MSVIQYSNRGDIRDNFKSVQLVINIVLIGDNEKRLLVKNKRITFGDMETQEIMKLFFPTIVKEETLDLYLDEGKAIPEDLRDKHVVSYGFTDYVTIQDFSIRGYITRLHIRKWKWQEKGTGKIYVKSYELTGEGTQLTKEFASFLKETCRVHGIKPEDYR